MQTTKSRKPAVFPSTRWSLIQVIQQRGADAAKPALDEICRNYWLPVYVFIRRGGKNATDAEDLTQGFFEKLLAGSFFEQPDRDRGRLRNYLLRSVKNYVAAEYQKQQAQKRGGSAELVFIDADHAEGLGLTELIPSSDLPPDESFERRWARDLLARGLQQLRGEYESKDQAELFEKVSPMLSEKTPGAIAETAAALGSTENAIRISLHRLKKRYQTIIRNEVRLTLEPGADVETELRYLAGLVG
ncbi:MAG: sigma-70 family RNA polymerase sigma factor [Verrucomicrobiota bacterium]